MFLTRRLWLWPFPLILSLMMSLPVRAVPPTNTELTCSLELEDMTAGTWNHYEHWAWDNNLCIGIDRVDFRSYQVSKHPPTKGDNTAILTSAFIKLLLTHQDAKAILAKYSTSSIHLMHGIFPSVLDLRDTKTDVELQFDDFRFRQDLIINGGTFGGIQITNSTIFGNLEGGKTSVLNDIFIQKSRIFGSLSLPRAEVEGYFIVNDTQVAKKIDLAFSRIAGPVSMVSQHTQCQVGRPDPKGSQSINNPHGEVALDLHHARLQHYIQIGHCLLFGHIRGFHAHVKAEFALVGSFVSKNIELPQAVIDGQFRVIDSNVNGNIDLTSSKLGRLLIRISPPSSRKDKAKPCSVGGEYRKAREIESCVIGGLYFSNSYIEGDLWVGGASDIRYALVGPLAGYSTHSTGRWDWSRLDIMGTANLKYVRVAKGFTVGDTSVYGEVDANRLVVGEDFSLTGSRIGKIRMHKAEIAGDLSMQRTDWKRIYLDKANVGGTLRLDQCANDQKYHPKYLSLRGAHLSSLSDGGCDWQNIYRDFFGWEYDSIPMMPILGRSASDLEAWISNNVWQEKNGQDVYRNGAGKFEYLYLADRLTDLGMAEKAKSIRIAERKKNLQELTGMEGVWQWTLGATTNFGYEPERTILWFVGLIVLGTVMLLATLCEWGSCFRKKSSGRFYFYGVLIATVMGLVFGGALGTVEMKENIGWTVDGNFTGSSMIAFVCTIMLWLALGADKIEVRSDESKWRRIKGAVLYSIDRAVPFLGFDSEHVHWFPEPETANGVGEASERNGAGKRRWINDIPVLGIYFYVHSLAGFGLISLFVAGLTGVLK